MVAGVDSSLQAQAQAGAALILVLLERLDARLEAVRDSWAAQGAVDPLPSVSDHEGGKRT